MSAGSPDHLRGVLERIVFFNEENHYTIAEFRPGDGTENKERSRELGQLNHALPKT